MITYSSHILFNISFFPQAFSPQSFPMQKTGFVPFAWPLSPNIPPYNPSPPHHPQHNTPSPRHKKDISSKTSHVAHDKKTSKASSVGESSNLSKEHFFNTKTQSPFIPLQVGLALAALTHEKYNAQNVK